jgi:hypothetical protein
MTLYMRFTPTVGKCLSLAARPKIGAIGMLLQTDKYGEHLVVFGSWRCWCAAGDLTLVKERDFHIQQAMEALNVDEET